MVFSFNDTKPVVWLVGGSGKLGQTIAEVLQSSFNVVNLSRSKGKDNAESYLNYSLDLSNLSEVFSSVQKLKNCCFPRAIVFCQRYRPTQGSFEADLTTAMNTEIFSTEQMIKETCGFSARGNLSIIVISSINSYLIDSGIPFWYHWLKSSQIQLMKYYSLQKQQMPFNINCIAPGTFLKFSFDDYSPERKKFLGLLEKSTPKNSVCTVLDIANIVEYLISDNAKCISGQIITPDGGLTFKMQEELIRNYDY